MKDHNIKPEQLLNMQGNVWVYWKDIHGCYLGSNDRMAIELNSSGRESVIGKNDYELINITPEDADEFRNEDKMVLSQGVTKHFQDKAILLSTTIHFHTIKIPLYNNKIITGIIGISYYSGITSRSQNDIANKLSKREHEVLQYLIRGKTAKGIARILKLSARTVESYLSNIKIKLNVHSKYELIEKVIEEFKPSSGCILL